jgi:adenylate cyclase
LVIHEELSRHIAISPQSKWLAANEAGGYIARTLDSGEKHMSSIELFDAIRRGTSDGKSQSDLSEDLWKRFGVDRAVLALDSSGFTRISKSHGIIYFLSTFLRMSDIVVPLMQRQNCRKVRTHADNLFAEFSDVDTAVNAALLAHQAIKDAKLQLTKDEPYSVCIGIGYGRVLEAGDEGVFGDEMNLAAKLGEDIAEGGDTLLSESAFKAITSPQKLVFDSREAAVSGNTIKYYAVRR